MYKLNHEHIYGFDKLYGEIYNGDVQSLKNWISRIENESRVHFPASDQDDERNKFKGDQLEVFAEIFYRLYETDERFGLRNYIPSLSLSDYGVDGTGINVNKQVSAVQIKFRLNPTDMITYEDLAKTDADARRYHNIDTLKKASIHLFTTTNEVSYQAKNFFKDSLIILDRSYLASKLDGNHNFWNIAQQCVQYTLED